MTRSFDSLADRVQATWSEEAHDVHAAASAVFTSEVSVQLSVGREVAAARQLRGVTQPELAALAGINQSEISRIENGRANPTIETISRLAAALGQQVRLAPLGGSTESADRSVDGAARRDTNRTSPQV